MSVKKDIETGKIAEKFVGEYFESIGCDVEYNREKKNLSFYDLIINNKYLIEIKYDIYAKKSGNIAIEYFNPKTNKASGITVTKSHFWIQVFSDPLTAWIIPTPTLKNIINTISPFRIVEKAGDGNASLMLYKTAEVLSQFSNLDFTNKEEFDDYVNRSRFSNLQ